MGASLRSKVDDKDRISAWLTLTTKSLTQKLDSIQLLKLAFEQLRLMKKIVSSNYCSNGKPVGSHLSGSGHGYAMQVAALVSGCISS